MKNADSFNGAIPLIRILSVSHTEILHENTPYVKPLA